MGADVYSEDYFINDAEYHARIIDGSTCDGSIVLFHVPDSPSRLQTLEIMQKALPRLHDRGFRFLRLTDTFQEEQGVWGYCGAGLLFRAFFALCCCVPCGCSIWSCVKTVRAECYRYVRRRRR